MLVELLERGFPQPTGLEDGGAVDQEVDRAEGGGGAIDQGRGGVRVAQVGIERNTATAEGFDLLHDARRFTRGAAVVDRHVGPGARQRQGDLAAEADGRSGHECGAKREGGVAQGTGSTATSRAIGWTRYR